MVNTEVTALVSWKTIPNNLCNIFHIIVPCPLPPDALYVVKGKNNDTLLGEATLSTLLLSPV